MKSLHRPPILCEASKIKKLKKKSGFTLIESLVVIAIFSILITLVTSIYIRVNDLQQRTASFQRLQNDGRYIIEKIAKEVRSREVDFVASGFDNLGFSNSLVFYEDEYGEELKVELVDDNLWYDVDGQRGALNANDVAVTGAQFFYAPITLTTVQPRVTMLIVFENRNVADKYKQTLTLQTTASSRFYNE